MESILTKLQREVHLPVATLPRCGEFDPILKQVRLLDLERNKTIQTSQPVINDYDPSSFLLMDDSQSKIVNHSANPPERNMLKFPTSHHPTKNLPRFIDSHGTHDGFVPYKQSVIFTASCFRKET